MNDGSFISHIAIDGLGNYVLPNATLFFGANIFTAVAYDTVGNSATAELISPLCLNLAPTQCLAWA